MSCTDAPMVVAPPIEHRIQPDTLVKIGGSDASGGPRFVVGYWSIRGLAAPLRMMLRRAGVPHWIALYDVLEEGSDGWTMESWMDADKPFLKKECNPFMNLPYLIDVREQLVICQTNAIQSYLGRALNMLGSTPLETAKCEELLCEIYDLRNVMVGFCYNSAMALKAESCLKRACSSHLDKLESHLERFATDREGFHLVGSACTAPDFHLFELLDQFETLVTFYKLGDENWLQSTYPRLYDFQTTMKEENAGYLSSFVHTNLPFNNPSAHFGSDPVNRGCQHPRGQDVSSWKQKGIIVE